MTIGERLKLLRIEKGLTQEEVGNIIGVTKGAIQKYENGHITNFRSDTIKQLCNLFGIAPAYFIFDEVEDNYKSTSSEQLRNMLVLHFGERFMTFLDVLNTLNEEGRIKVIEYTNDICMINKYKRDRYKKEERP